MIDYAVYDNATGRIIRTGVTNNLAAQAISPNEVAVAAKALPSTHYVVDGTVTPRPMSPASASKTLIAADGVDECLIGNIPAGTRISVDGPVSGGVADVQDGEFAFTTEVSGVYQVTLFSFPARNATFEVTAA